MNMFNKLFLNGLLLDMESVKSYFYKKVFFVLIELSLQIS